MGPGEMGVGNPLNLPLKSPPFHCAAICIGASYQIPGPALTTPTDDHSISYSNIFNLNKHGFDWLQPGLCAGSLEVIKRWILGKYVAH